MFEIILAIIALLLFGCFILFFQMFLYHIATKDLTEEEIKKFDEELNKQMVYSNLYKNNQL